MYKKNVQIIMLVLLMIGSSMAGDKIKLKLHQPPPNKMPVSSLWQMDIENTTREEITIYLVGTASGDRQGEIVGGTSKPFTVKPGKKTYGYEDFKSGEVKWVNKSIQEIIFRTGEVPEDNYTICVTAYYEDGKLADQQQCIMHPVGPTLKGIISLISPSDNEELKPETPINFMWTGTGLKGPYTLIIKELKNGQTNEQAMKENRIFFEKKDLNSTNFQYPNSEKKFEVGKKYAWQISTGEIASDVWAFSPSVTYQITVDSVVITCSPQSPTGQICYLTKLYIHNYNTGTGISSTARTRVESIISPPLNANSWTNWTNVQYPNQVVIIGNLCYTNQLTPPLNVTFNVKMEDQVNSGFMAMEPITKNLPLCGGAPTNCCDAFQKRITQNFDTESKIMSFTMMAGPKRIRKVAIDLVYVNAQTDNNCPVCKNNWSYWGNFFCWSCSLGGFGAANSSESRMRELVWGSDGGPGVDMFSIPRSGTTNILLDQYVAGNIIACCRTTVDYCIRYSFTDTTCNTCDTVICYSVTLGGSNDTTMQRFKEIEKQMEMQPEINKLEKNELQEKEPTTAGFGNEENSTKTEPIKSIESNLKPSNNPPSNITVTITSDNAYVFGFGDVNGITDYRSPGIANKLAQEIYSSDGSGVEQYPISNADMNGFIYIAAWSDEQTYQGLIAEFSDGVNTINTSHPNWEVYATGLDIDPITNENCNYPYIAPHHHTNSNYPILGSIGSTNLQEINGQITIANSNSGNISSSSIGWVKGFATTGRNGKLAIGPPNIGVSYGFPPQTVSNLSQTTRWLWYDDNENNTNIQTPFTNVMQREYLIFRIGPIGDVLQSGCCATFSTTVTSQYDGQSGIKVKYSSNHKIKRIIADIVDFRMTYSNDACKTCVSDSKQWGNFKTPVTAITGLSNPRLTIPTGTSTNISREIVWGSINGPAKDLSQPTALLTLPISIPPKHSSGCCADTIKYCVRYKFYDDACVQCDTTICYKIVRSPGTHGTNGIEKYYENDVKTGEIQNTEPSIENNFYHGETAGMVNVDLIKSAEVKLVVYDINGKEILKLYDDYMKEGKYAFDLGKYNLPDGVYFYKLNNGDDIKYEKVLIAKSCNCGSK